MTLAALSSTRIAKKLTPVQAGAKRLAAQYGEHLVCVRYRIDDDRKRRYTTVELVVDEQAIMTTAASKMVGVRIAYGEPELRAKVKSAGGKWDAESRLWRLPRNKAKALGLTKRIVEETEAAHA